MHLRAAGRAGLLLLAVLSNVSIISTLGAGPRANRKLDLRTHHQQQHASGTGQEVEHTKRVHAERDLKHRRHRRRRHRKKKKKDDEEQQNSYEETVGITGPSLSTTNSIYQSVSQFATGYGKGKGVYVPVYGKGKGVYEPGKGKGGSYRDIKGTSKAKGSKGKGIYYAGVRGKGEIGVEVGKGKGVVLPWSKSKSKAKDYYSKSGSVLSKPCIYPYVDYGHYSSGWFKPPVGKGHLFLPCAPRDKNSIFFFCHRNRGGSWLLLRSSTQ